MALNATERDRALQSFVPGGFYDPDLLGFYDPDLLGFIAC